jgi:ubiquinone/menaquinone biosynthesis C-methylase UbiE
MSESQEANRDQAALWNGSSGSAWVEMQDVLDRVLAPFEMLLSREACPGEGGHVLDVGCGSGATTIAMARRLGSTGLCVGVDISEPLLRLAKERAITELGAVEFVLADAQTYDFEPESFDSVMSRFGVMFFDDPEAAFINIRKAARYDAKLAFVAWRSPAENPFMTTALRDMFRDDTSFMVEFRSKLATSRFGSRYRAWKGANGTGQCGGAPRYLEAQRAVAPDLHGC